MGGVRSDLFPTIEDETCTSTLLSTVPRLPAAQYMEMDSLQIWEVLWYDGYKFVYLTAPFIQFSFC